MPQIPNDYIERCYAGWLGKMIGVRFGIPIEGWSYERIKKVYGTLDTYIDTYKKLFAADDDTNAPLSFLSALYDYTYTSDITAEQIGLALLNQAPYEHGFSGGADTAIPPSILLTQICGQEFPRLFPEVLSKTAQP